MPLMPIMLLGLLGMSIPVIIHLLHRQRTQPVKWGAMQFLKTSPLQMKRKKKVDHWLLMLVRILALGVLAFLLSQPQLKKNIFPKGVASSPIDVAVVLDHSLSTGRMSNGQTIFDHGVSVTDKMLEQLKPSDTFSVVLAEHNPKALNAQPIKKSDGGSIQELRQRLGQEKPGMTDCSIPKSISAARKLLSLGRNPNKLIIVVSDQQRANWHIKDDAMWRSMLGDRSRELAKNLSVHAFPIMPDADMSNITVASIGVQPTILGVNRPVQINATVSNTGTKQMTGMFARLIVNGKEVDTKPVPQLGPKTAATVRFDIDQGLTQAGSNWVKVAVNSVDALQGDNEAVAAANVLAHIPVLIIDGQFSSAGTFKSSQFLQAAMQPQESSLVQAKIVTVADAMTAKLDDYTAVVVNDVPMLPSQMRDRLAEYARNGHGLWFILGPKTQRSSIQKDMPGTGFFRAELDDIHTAPQEEGGGVVVKDSTNPMLQLVAANERNALTGAATRKWWGLKPGDADTQVILAAANGDPLIMERPFGTNRGMVVVWATSADGGWNNWSLMPNFVPMVNEAIYHLASAQMRGLENHGIEAGQPIEWAGPAKPAVQSVQITLPDGSAVTRPATFNNGRYILTYPDTYLPGIYRLQFTPTEIPPVFYGVNIDHTELDPTALDKDDINWLTSGNFLDDKMPTLTEADLPTVIRRENQTLELWGWLGGALLVGLLIETFLTYRLIGSQKKVDVAGAGLITPHAA